MRTSNILIVTAAVLTVIFAKPIVKDGTHDTMRGFLEGDTGTTDWWQTGQDSLLEAIETTINITQQIRQAKNVILFIGDGMGVSTVSAARIYHAQSRQLMGYDVSLAFEKFPYLALSKTYNTDSQTPDSAGTATAYTSGYKAKIGTLGVNQHVYRGNCTNVMENRVKSFIHTATEKGKWGGVVTTTRVTHATPAATYAHAGDRDWECDGDQWNVPDRAQCPDIAYQLVESDENSNFRVILGGGRQKFMRNDQADPEYPTRRGCRRDSIDLIQNWLDKRNAQYPGDPTKYTYVYDGPGFDSTNENELEYLLGLFEPSHMLYESERVNEPSLKEMTTKAIKMLQKSENGYALLVEGGRIDHAHHDSWAANAMIETVALSDAVQAAVDLTDESDTLIVVTADHSHVLAFNGYPYISNDILGLVREENSDHTDTELVAMDDGKPYLTMGYLNGPGFTYHRQNGSVNAEEIPRKDLTDDSNIGTPFYRYDTAMLVGSETHGGEDVGIYARGPMSHLFHGVQEQNYIAHVMMYAACIGPNTDHCDKPPQYPDCPAKDSGNLLKPLNSFILMLAAFSLGVFLL